MFFLYIFAFILYFKDDELEEEKSLLDSTNDLLKSPSGSAKSTSPENIPIQPTKKISLKRNVSVTVPVIERELSEVTEVTSDSSANEPEKKIVKISELSAKERLEMRAKKFAGTESSTATVVVAAPQERLQARAARFGVASTEKSTSEAPKVAPPSASSDVLKKRAERFGAVLVPEPKKIETQEKLQKREERFGGSAKTTITGPSTTSSDMAEKALKRLERFKQTA